MKGTKIEFPQQDVLALTEHGAVPVRETPTLPELRDFVVGVLGYWTTSNDCLPDQATTEALAKKIDNWIFINDPKNWPEMTDEEKSDQYWATQGR